MSLSFNFSSQRLAVAAVEPGVQSGGQMVPGTVTSFENESAAELKQPYSPFLAQWNAAPSEVSAAEPIFKDSSFDREMVLPMSAPQSAAPAVRDTTSWDPVSSPFRAPAPVAFIPPRPMAGEVQPARSVPPVEVAAPVPPPYSQVQLVEPVRAPDAAPSALDELHASVAEIKMSISGEFGRSQKAMEERLDELSAALHHDVQSLNTKTAAECQQIRDDLFSTAMGMSALKDQQQVLLAQLNAVSVAVSQRDQSGAEIQEQLIASHLSGVQEILAAFGQQTSDALSATNDAIRLIEARVNAFAENSASFLALKERVDSFAEVANSFRSLNDRLDAVSLAATSIKPLQTRVDALAATSEAVKAIETRVDSIVTRDIAILKHRTERAEERAARALTALEAISDSERLAGLWNVPEEPAEAQKFASTEAVEKLQEHIAEMAAKQRFADTLLKSVEEGVIERCERMVASKLALVAEETNGELASMESRLMRQLPIEQPAVEAPEGCGLLAMDAKTEFRIVELVEELVVGKLKELVTPLVRADLNRRLGEVPPDAVQVSEDSNEEALV